jgi:hypothetical protein
MCSIKGEECTVGNFENAIPKNIRELELQMGAKRREIWAIEAKYVHDCNCEYCSERGGEDDIPDEAKKEMDDLIDEISDAEVMINRLKRHAKVSGIELAAKS